MATNYFRSTPTRGSLPRVDKERAVIHGLSLFQTGVVALGHGVMGDEITAALLVQLGNRLPNGVKSRFAHPGLSESGTGRQVAQVRNLSVQGDKVIGDAYFLESARRSPVFNNDPVDYLLEFADESPTDMGMSVVIDSDAVWKSEDGEEFSIYENENVHFSPVNEIPLLRPTSLSAVDFVDEPAANRDGMFGVDGFDFFSGTGSELPEWMFERLDAMIAELGITPEKAYQFTQRYFHSRLWRGSSLPNLEYRDALDKLSK